MTLLSKKKILRNVKEANLINLDRIYIVKKTSSTNDDAKISLRKDNLKITAFFAERQTSGRGRNKRNWISPFGKNIYFSFAWKADLNLNQLDGLSLATAVVVAKSIQKTIPAKIGIKWPNDLMISNKKMGGILIETKAIDKNISEVIIGIGLNVNMSPEEGSAINQQWTSMSNYADSLLDRNLIAGITLNSILQLSAEFKELGFSFYKKSFQDLHVLNKKRCVVSFPKGEKLYGNVIGVNDRGEILITNNDNTLALSHGEVSIRESEIN